jgi:CPA1 family monovalent cation:H+ antiporter
MQFALIFVLLLSFVLGLGLIARRLNIPYPILFVIGGLFISFIPILPQQLTLDPDLIFFLFLPPLLYIQAFYTSWRDFRFYLRPILALAVGLVITTTVIVAFVAHWLIPDVGGTGNLPLAVGFVLGAIVSPPDAIAASAIASRLGLPRRIVTILEGESLVNDATSLVLFKVAVAAVGATGMSFIGKAWLPGEFIWVSVGGIAVGLLIGRIAGWVRRRIVGAGPQIFMCMSLMAPYLAYLCADQFLHVSGVLAVVALGLYLGWESPEVLTFDVRLQAQAVWDMIIYLLNGIVFVLIGLQLPGIIRSMHEHWWPYPFFQALLISLVCIVVRMLWIYPGAYLPRWLFKHIRDTEEKPPWQQVTVIGWAGMRGVVSLAAALALSGYPDFPRPHIVQFIAFTVILVTLVFQGLTLPPLIRFLKVGDDGIPAKEEGEARRQILKAVFAKIDELRNDDKFPVTAIENVEKKYTERSLIFDDPLIDELGWSDTRHHVLSIRRLTRLMVATQRRALVAMRREGKIGDDVLHKIEHELDLEESRLKS